MALPTSGQLALSTIRDEFGAGTTSNVSLRTLSAAAGLSVPDGFNEFYGLSAYTPPSYISGATTISGSGTQSNPYVISRTSGFSNYTFVQSAACDEFYAGSPYVEETFADSTFGNNTIKFRVQQNNAQRMFMTINTFNTSTLCSVYNLAEIYWGGTLTNTINNSTYLNKFNNGGITGASQLKDLVQNVQWNLPSGNQNLELRLFLTTRAYVKYSEWLPGDCEGFGDPWYTETYGCPSSISTSNFTFTMWWEPV